MTEMYHGLTRFDRLVKECLENRALSGAPLPQVFGRLFPENPITGDLSTEHILGAFDALIESMKTDEVKAGHADAGMTFFGQFVDHDITLDAQSAIGTRIDPRSIRNIRTPALDLDCVYGDGPEASPHLYSEKHEGFLLFGRDENHRDLARNCRGTALIGDPRNDENVIVSQVQGAFIMLHNILMNFVSKDGDEAKDIHECAVMGIRSKAWEDAVAPRLRGFEEVRRFIRLHYQYIVANELLPSFISQASIDAVRIHDPFSANSPIMPAEFSGAAYRFGHVTVQSSYMLKSGGQPFKLFDMTGFKKRMPDSDIEFGQFFSTPGKAAQKARPVGTKMAESLFNLPFVHKELKLGDVQVSLAQSRKLGLRNILRDRFALELASGQQAARILGMQELAAPTILRDKHITKTPLWYYCLHEAEKHGDGRLTGVGGAIVASVFFRLLALDSESIVHTHGFTPWSGFGGNQCSMGNIMAFVDAHWNTLPQAPDLRCG